MEFTVDHKELATALGTVAPAIPVAHTAYSSVRVDVENGEATLVGTDLEFTIETTLNVVDSTDGVAVIPFRVFNELIKSLKDDVTVSCNSDDVREITVTSGGFEASVRGVHPDDFPLIKEVSGVDVVVETQTLSDAIAQVVGAASKDEARPILTGVLFRNIDSKLNIVATDSYRLAVSECSDSLGDGDSDVLLPAKAAVEIVKLFSKSDNVKVTLGDNAVRFSSGSTKVASRLIDGDYPKYEGLIPKEAPFKFTVNSDALADVVKRVRLMARESVPVKLVLNSDRVSLEATTLDVGNASEIVEGVYVGEDLTIGFNPEFLMYGLNETNGNIVFEITSDSKPVIIRNETVDGFTYLLMPVRT